MRFQTIALLFLFTTSLCGQGVISLSINTSADTILMDNAFKVELLVKNGAMKNFEAPVLEAFDLLQGPSRSISTSYINGEKSSMESYTYYFKPLQPGKFSIKQFELDIDGQSYKSNDKTITVIENPDNLFQDPNTGQIEGYTSMKKKSPKRKRFKI